METVSVRRSDRVNISGAAEPVISTSVKDVELRWEEHMKNAYMHSKRTDTTRIVNLFRPRCREQCY